MVLLVCLLSIECRPLSLVGNVGGSGGSSSVPVLSDADSNVSIRVGARLDREHSNVLDQNGPEQEPSPSHTQK